LEFRNVDFCGGMETGEPGEKLEVGQEPTTNPTHLCHQVQDLNLGHIGGRQALSLLGHPFLPISIYFFSLTYLSYTCVDIIYKSTL